VVAAVVVAGTVVVVVVAGPSVLSLSGLEPPPSWCLPESPSVVVVG
jgi:hypothetical protein